jgi:flagellar assembly protein FliH
MSNSPLIPKEQLSAYQRWELHSFDAPDVKLAETPAKAAADAEKVRHLHQRTYDAGRADGHADGLREGAATAATEAVQMKALLASITQQTHEVNQRLAHDVLELALEVARQMVRQTLAVRPELIVTLIQDALARTVLPLATATLTLNPADAVLVRAQMGGELAATGWRIVDDPKVACGGALLQTSATQIDATVGTRWQRLAAALGQHSEWMS